MNAHVVHGVWSYGGDCWVIYCDAGCDLGTTARQPTLDRAIKRAKLHEIAKRLLEPEVEEPQVCENCGATGHTFRQREDDGSEWNEDCVFEPAFDDDGRARSRCR